MRTSQVSLHTDAVTSYLNVQIPAGLHNELSGWVTFKLSTKLLCKWWPMCNCIWQNNKMAGAITRSKLYMQFSYICVYFKNGQWVLTPSIDYRIVLYNLCSISVWIAVVWISAKVCLHMYLTLYQPMMHRCVITIVNSPQAYGNLYGVLILGVILQYMACASFSCFLWLVKG